MGRTSIAAVIENKEVDDEAIFSVGKEVLAQRPVDLGST